MGFCATTTPQVTVLQGGEDFSAGWGGQPSACVLVLVLVKGQAGIWWVDII